MSIRIRDKNANEKNGMISVFTFFLRKPGNDTDLSKVIVHPDRKKNRDT